MNNIHHPHISKYWWKNVSTWCRCNPQCTTQLVQMVLAFVKILQTFGLCSPKRNIFDKNKVFLLLGFRSEIFCTHFAYLLKSIFLKFSFQGSEYHYEHNKNFWTEIFYPGYKNQKLFSIFMNLVIRKFGLIFVFSLSWEHGGWMNVLTTY